jgi:hypothetical protein
LKYSLLAIVFLLLSGHTRLFAQNKIQPGFDAGEYVSLLSLAFYGRSIPDSAERTTEKEIYSKLYVSPEVGLKNQWSLFLRNDNVAVVCIRGTVPDKLSWAANFYAAMIPATGTIFLNDSTSFKYQLAADDQATVHVGWTVALASMAPDIVSKIKELYAKGVRNIYITGHSQGGAIAFLVRSYLYYLQQDGTLPKDILFKTYCSAAPKPGNLYYAYDFENITRNGWAYTIVNRLDWVPETPYTIQRMQDMNELNPLIHTKDLLKNQKLPLKLAGGFLYGKLNRKPRKAQKVLTRYLGSKMYKIAIKKALPQFKEPQYIPSDNYMRAGNPVVLIPDDEYRQQFKGTDDYFIHHGFKAYYFLTKKHYPGTGK